METPMPQPAARAPRPLGVADMIPVEAAGRQPLFFFGTLMDLDILTYVLRRPLAMDALEPATLAGFRRVCAREASYPVLISDALGAVEGVLLHAPTPRDIERINHFESGEYRAELHEVHGVGGRRMEAWLFAALEEELSATDQPWDLASWVGDHKAEFFARCDVWMADCRDWAH
jgi:hypothetical protein